MVAGEEKSVSQARSGQRCNRDICQRQKKKTRYMGCGWHLVVLSLALPCFILMGIFCTFYILSKYLSSYMYVAEQQNILGSLGMELCKKNCISYFINLISAVADVLPTVA